MGLIYFGCRECNLPVHHLLRAGGDLQVETWTGVKE